MRPHDLRAILALCFLLLPGTIFAQVPTHEPDRSVFLSLSEDVFHEVMTMDAVTETQEERREFISKLRRRMSDETAPNPTLEAGKSWSGLWPGPSVLPSPATLTHSRVRVEPKAVDLNQHSLKAPRAYVEQRLGEATVSVLARKEALAVVYGGRAVSAFTDLGVDPESVVRIPSFYERWGIAKFLVPSSQFADGKPRLVITVPPSFQYLEHYATMMKAIGIPAERVVLDRNDQFLYRKTLIGSVERIASRIKGHVDFAVLGYYEQWMTHLVSGRSEWTLVNASPEVSGELGLTGRTLEIRNETTNETVRLLLVKSDLTIWGQASSFIADALLSLSPRGLIFMGSSGSLVHGQELYGLSVPRQFVTKTGANSIDNFIRPAEKGADVQVRAASKHGHTFSPIEQDRDYLLRLKKAGIETIDVEQSLIAKAVADHNRVTGANVKFGAVNLITDRPADILGERHAEHDLDRVDWERKRRAREAAVGLALKAIGEVTSARANPGSALICRDLFRAI